MNSLYDEQTRTHYLAPRVLLEKYRADFHSFGFHDLPDGIVLAHASFLTFASQEKFEAEQGVVTFPHWSSPRPIGDVLASAIAKARVAETLQTEPFSASDTMDDVCRKIAPKWATFPTDAHRTRLRHP